jgi:hypothetical protein
MRKTLTTLATAVVVAAVLLAPATAAWAAAPPGHLAPARSEASAWAAALDPLTTGWEALVRLFGLDATTLSTATAAGGTADSPVACSACGEPFPSAGGTVDPNG